MQLFHRGELREFFESEQKRIPEEIDNFDLNYLTNIDEKKILDYFLSKYQINPIILKKDSATMNYGDIDIDVRNYPNYFTPDRSRPHYIKGTRIVISIPFEGDPELFFLRPSTFTYSPPYGEILGNSLEISFDFLEQEDEYVKAEYEKKINEIEKYLKWQNDEIKKFNEKLIDLAKEHIRNRKEKLMRDKKIVSSLNIPLKYSDLSKTFEIPKIKQKISIKLPDAVKVDSKQEPSISNEDYSNVLKIIQILIVAMERSPRTFSKLSEEELRDFILVYLNGIFEGSATGETFNESGKTDILIRYNGKNIFIAECKFWEGVKSFSKAIDQLLSYISWRDTKTAIIIFNKRKNFSEVLKKIEESIPIHSNYMRSFQMVGESNFRAVFHHNDDEKKELNLSVLAFEIPSE